MGCAMPDGARVTFLPFVRTERGKSERTPSMLRMLSQWYDIKAIRPGWLDRVVFDQSRPRFLRYSLFMLDEMDLFLRALIISRQLELETYFL